MKKNKIKIICTLGPSSSSEKVLAKMIHAGMDVARLNFSHGTHESHLQNIKILRRLNKKYRRDVKILQDLEGFRIRIGELSRWPGKMIPLKKHQAVILSNNLKCFKKGIIPFDYEGPLHDIKAGSHIYIDDGNIALLVKKVFKDYLTAVALVPGTIKEHKGINIPDAKLSFDGLTEKDHTDLLFGIKHGVDFVAQSFVRNKEDALNIRRILTRHHSKAKFIAKIENHEGVKNVNEILAVCDGVMIARGDLGVCLPIYEIPFLQKMLIKKCKARGKFAITATQMLESMTEHIRPTRAEVTDVANSIIDGTDYTMLSGETAAGQYPVETVKMMRDICQYTEDYLSRERRSKKC